MKQTLKHLRRVGAIAAAAAAAGLLLVSGPAPAQQPGKIKIGLMLPYTGTLRRAGQRDHQRVQARDRGERRQARRARDRVLHRRRRVGSGQGARKRQQADQARPGRRAGRHRPLGRGAGHGQGRPRHQHAAHHPQRRRRRDHRPAVRGQRVPHVVLELAAGHRDGQGDGRAEEEDGGHAHLEVRGGRRVGRRLQGGVRGGRRQGDQGTVPAVPAGRVPVAS